MTTTKTIILTLLLSITQQGFAQNAKFYIIKDADTLKPQETAAKAFLDVANQLLAFSSSDSLIYPTTINPDSINSIVIVYQNDTLSFFNFKEKLRLKATATPVELVRILLPQYRSIFEDKRNMYFSIDRYPFENDLRKEAASENVEIAKQPIANLTVIELYYQVKELYTLEPRPKNYR